MRARADPNTDYIPFLHTFKFHIDLFSNLYDDFVDRLCLTDYCETIQVAIHLSQ